MFTVLQLGGKFCLDLGLHIIKQQNAFFVPHKDHAQAFVQSDHSLHCLHEEKNYSPELDLFRFRPPDKSA